jgi:hypothetical protein
MVLDARHEGESWTPGPDRPDIAAVGARGVSAIRVEDPDAVLLVTAVHPRGLGARGGVFPAAEGGTGSGNPPTADRRPVAGVACPGLAVGRIPGSPTWSAAGDRSRTRTDPPSTQCSPAGPPRTPRRRGTFAWTGARRSSPERPLAISNRPAPSAGREPGARDKVIANGVLPTQYRPPAPIDSRRTDVERLLGTGCRSRGRAHSGHRMRSVGDLRSRGPLRACPEGLNPTLTLVANSVRGVWRPGFAFPAYCSLPRLWANDPRREFANSRLCRSCDTRYDENGVGPGRRGLGGGWRAGGRSIN